MKIESFVRALEPRLYHACQLRDLELYASLGHVASRREMFDLQDTNRYTPFESDDFDVENEHDRSIFGNLSDGGNAYNNGLGMPNAYGPITLEFAPSAVANGRAGEIHVRENGVFTRNVAGSQAVTTPAALHQLYVDSKGFGKGEFEILGGNLLLTDAARVTVAPIIVNGRRLVNSVQDVLRGVVNCDIVERTGPRYHADHFIRLVEWASGSPQHQGEVASLPGGLREWFTGINGAEPTKGNNLRRLANYLEHGTLSRLRDQPGHLTAMQTEVHYAPDIEYEGDEYDRYDVSSHATLSQSELSERDDQISEIEQARAMALSSGHRYGSMLEDEAPDDDVLDEARMQAELDYEEVVAAIEAANEWIEGLRGRIEWSIDEVSHMTATAHDSGIVAELTEWMDSLKSVEPVDAVEFNARFDNRDYELEVDLSPLEDLQTEIESRVLYVALDE